MLLPLPLLLLCLFRAHVTMMIDKRRYCRIVSFLAYVVCCCCRCCCSLSEPLSAVTVVSMRDLERSFIISWYLNIRDIFRLLFFFFLLFSAAIGGACAVVNCVCRGLRYWNKMAVVVVASLPFGFSNFFADICMICLMETLESYCIFDWI